MMQSSTREPAANHVCPEWMQGIVLDDPIDVSVCIANWNCRQQLRDCLHSLLRQPQGVRLQVIVVDNASTDGAIDSARSEFPEAEFVVNNENRGFAKASNQAAALARGRYLLFLNNDTVVPAYALRKLFAYARKHPDVGMIGPRLVDTDGSYQISYRARPTVTALMHRALIFRWSRIFAREYRRYRRGGYDPQHRGPVDLLMGAAVFMPREVFVEVGRWDEDFAFGGEDLELAARVGRRHPVHFLPDVEITHHGRVSSRLNVGFTTESVAIGYVQFLRKTGSNPLGINLYKLAVTLDGPLQFISNVVQYCTRRLCRNRARAQKSALAARGIAHFMTRSLPKFWRA